MRRRIVVHATLGLLALATLGGCRTGMIFTKIVEPLDTNYRETLIVDRARQSGRSDIRHLEYQGVQVQWNTNGIADIAKQAGFEEVYYADLETFSLFGIWNEYTVHVYGRRAGEAEPEGLEQEGS